MSTTTEAGSRLVWWAWCLALALPTLALQVSLSPTLSLSHVPLDQAVSTWPPLARALVLQPDAGLAQAPWVWWTTAWLHGSTPHLVRNLVGLALLAVWAAATRPSRATVAALWLAWPLTQLGMLMGPSLSAYVGLSGVLHAGLVVLSVGALAPTVPWPLRVGALALLMGTGIKVHMENPWGTALVASPTSAIMVAPWAHLSGCVAGALSCAWTWALARGRRQRTRCH